MTKDEWLPNVHVSQNIQRRPDLYELENQRLDEAGDLAQALWTIADWDGRLVVDLGAGDGYYLPMFHERCQHLFAVEPNPGARLRAMKRVVDLQLERCSVLAGSAERIFLPDTSVDIVHARFAYFWGPGCEAGLQEVERIIRPNGTFYVIDNDLRRGQFANWLGLVPGFDEERAARVEDFWRTRGYQQTTVMTQLTFQSADELESVVRNEFDAQIAKIILSTQTELEVSYGLSIYSRTFC